MGAPCGIDTGKCNGVLVQIDARDQFESWGAVFPEGISPYWDCVNMVWVDANTCQPFDPLAPAPPAVGAPGGRARGGGGLPLAKVALGTVAVGALAYAFWRR